MAEEPMREVYRKDVLDDLYKRNFVVSHLLLMGRCLTQVKSN